MGPNFIVQRGEVMMQDMDIPMLIMQYAFPHIHELDLDEAKAAFIIVLN